MASNMGANLYNKIIKNIETLACDCVATKKRKNTSNTSKWSTTLILCVRKAWSFHIQYSLQKKSSSEMKKNTKNKNIKNFEKRLWNNVARCMNEQNIKMMVMICAFRQYVFGLFIFSICEEIQVKAFSYIFSSKNYKIAQNAKNPCCLPCCITKRVYVRNCANNMV